MVLPCWSHCGVRERRGLRDQPKAPNAAFLADCAQGSELFVPRRCLWVHHPCGCRCIYVVPTDDPWVDDQNAEGVAGDTVDPLGASARLQRGPHAVAEWRHASCFHACDPAERRAYASEDHDDSDDHDDGDGRGVACFEDFDVCPPALRFVGAAHL